MDSEIPFTIKFLADKSGVSVSTLRTWLEKGVFEPVGENAQGHPVFSNVTVERVSLARKCRAAGYGLSWVKHKTTKTLGEALHS